MNNEENALALIFCLFHKVGTNIIYDISELVNWLQIF